VSRVIAFVDGLNLYHGLREKYGRRYHWLDLQALATSLLRPDQRLHQVQYFTARVRDKPDSEQRQHVYLSALAATCPAVAIVEGRFQKSHRHCVACSARWTTYVEKESDVSLAAALIRDAVLDRYDVAMLVSADADLCPALRAVRDIAPNKRLVAAFPPRRQSDALRLTADAAFTISDTKIRQCQLAEKITTAAGVVLARPAYWR